MPNRIRKGMRQGQGLSGSDTCTCSKCGYTEKHERGIPCAQKKCPKCGSRLLGEICYK